MSIFSLDSHLIHFLDKAADIIILNILYIICSIPLITIGAANSAAFIVADKLRKNEETSVVKDFFSGFKSTFKKSTLCWIIMMITGLILIFDFKIASTFTIDFVIPFRIVITIVGVIYLFTLLYLFQYISRFNSGIFLCFKNSFFLSIANLPYTIMILVLIFLCALVTYIVGIYITASFWTLAGFASLIYSLSSVYTKVFDSINIKLSSEDYRNENA